MLLKDPLNRIPAGWTRRIFLFAVSVSLPFALSAQTILNSPYSRYGLGELQYTGFANTIPMGGIYCAVQNDTSAPFQINFSNPASHATLRITSFDVGFKSNTTMLETQDKKFLTSQSALSYMVIGFPVVKKWWGASFGLLPYSSVGYKIYDKQEVENIGTVNYTYEGEGGINQLYLGNGVRLGQFYAGINASYMFGDLQFFSRDSFPKTGNFFNARLEQTARVSDGYYSFGLQYRQNLKKNWSVTLGMTGGLESNINVKRSTFAATYSNLLGVEVIKDTIINDVDVADTVTIPMFIGGGLVIRKGDRWMIGLDYTMQDWSSFSSFNQTGLLKNSNRLSFGIQYVPDKNAGSKEPYYKKIFYRAGFRMADTYLELNSTQLKDMAITFGAGFPLRKVRVLETFSQSVVNFGVELGQRGTTDNSLIRERYVKAVLGITLNDRWFIKRKYD